MATTTTANQVESLRALGWSNGKISGLQERGKLTVEFADRMIGEICDRKGIQDRSLAGITAHEEAATAAFRAQRDADRADLDRCIAEAKMAGTVRNSDLFAPTRCGCMGSNGVDMCTTCGHSPA